MAKITQPRNIIQRLLNETISYSMVSALCTSIVALIGSKRLFSDNPPNALLGWIIIVAALVNLICLLRKEFIVWKEKGGFQDTHELIGCLHTLHATLIGSWDNPEDPCLRVTVHLPINEEKDLQQLVDYVGDDRGGKTARRVFRSTCGVTAEAIKRTGELIVADRGSDDYSSYLEDLQSTQGYKESEAKKLNPATMSWAAIALQSKKKVVAVVYCDSTVRGFFDDERQALLVNACAGIARFVDCDTG